MVGTTTPKEGGMRVSIKASSRSFNRPRSPSTQLNLNVILWIFLLLAIFVHLSATFVNFDFVNFVETFQLKSEDLSNENNSSPDHGCRDDDAFVLASARLPNDTRFYPTIANGFIGYKMFNDTVFMNGLYNGKHGGSHRARIPNPISFVRRKEDPTHLKACYTQNMKKGIFSMKISSDSVDVEQIVYAHKLYTRLLVSEIIFNMKEHGVYDIIMYNTSGQGQSEDIAFGIPEEFIYNQSLCNKSICTFLLNVSSTSGKTKIPEEDFSRQLPIHIISSKFPTKIILDHQSGSLPSMRKYIFMSSIASRKDEAEFFYLQGVGSVAAGTLQSRHVKEWKQTWIRGDFDVTGNVAMNRAIKSSLYYLLSSFPPLNMEEKFPFKFYGVSPGGLPHGAQGHYYFGHVFWDQDYWMAPAVLPFYPDLVKMVLKYRIGNLLPAREKAKSLGYLGAAYPWETAYTGYDVCPGEEYVKQEIHVTGDVIHLLKQYIYVTDDWNMFFEQVGSSGCEKIRRFGKASRRSSRRQTRRRACVICKSQDFHDCSYLTAWDMLRDTAVFWQSRTEWSELRRSYVINDVMGPDEWNSPVNNSAFTNAIAARNLKFAADVATKLRICRHLALAWDYTAERMLLPYSETLRYHPEFDGFDPDYDVIKQADTIMLGFPLMVNSTDDVRKNDLIIYEGDTTRDGPAMTWGMFAINWLSLDDNARSASMFLRQMRNIHPPFNVWSEEADGSGATNFLTGMGGFLQSVVYGYFGLRILEDSMTINPVLIPYTNISDVDEMTFHGLNYRGFSFKVKVSRDAINITLLESRKSGKPPCALINVASTHEQYNLCVAGDYVVVNRSKCEISVEL